MNAHRALAPAKINLGLFVGPVRGSDGRHELTTVMQSISLADELTLEAAPAGGERDEVLCPGVPGDPDENLAARAVRAFRERTGWRAPPLRLRIDKRIPVAAGLGGGSADAAAALRLLAKANKLKPNDPHVLAVAAATGADVPAALDSRARLMTGAGDILSKPLRLAPLHAVLVFPGVPAATAAVFRTYDEMTANEVRAAGQVAHPDADAIPRERATLLDILHRQPNDLTRAARAVAPAVAAAEEMLDEVGDARLIRMTGSGSCVFALYDDLDMAEASADAIRDERPDWWVVATTLR
jgi:4-diphosphocytidyl-2-C-methyl-D-erythritol kinase